MSENVGNKRVIKPDLAVQIGGVRLKNPVLTASGTSGYGLELAPYLDLGRLGGFTTKSVTLEPRPGNPPERIVETPGGMLNAIGLANVGLERFMAEKMPEIASLGTAVLVNVAGHRLEDYVEVCRGVDAVADAGRGESIVGVELNVSCPNVSDGLVFGTDPAALRDLVAAVRPVVTRGVLVVKLSPNVTDITATARAAIEGGADALSMINTFLGMAIDTKTWRPALANRSGGLSGPAIKPLAIHLVHRVWKEVARDAGVPIIGMGGIATWQDAVEFLLAGASAVAVGTALFATPTAPIEIIDGLSAYLSERDLGDVSELVGRVADGGGEAEDRAAGAGQL
jgi:dihydroorotate dehydrogenase (NAD+) catalytic subunit